MFPPILPLHLWVRLIALVFLMAICGRGQAWAQLPSTVYVSASFAGTTPGDDPDGDGPATAFGTDAFATIQEGINGAAAAGTVYVGAGLYVEDVTLNAAGLRLIGAGADTTTLSGPKGGSGSTVSIAANNVEVAGFTITREGNNVTDWNDPTLNTAGISIQGQIRTGNVIHDNILTGNRTGIDINNSNGNTIRNNVIDSNRIGLIFRNQTDNLVVEENFITNSFAVGISFLDASAGTNSPVQSAANSSFRYNNISGNWYGGIVDRQSGGSLPTPGTNPKNFVKNWFGTSTPIKTTSNSAELGYAAQIPVAYGGSAVAPGNAPDIAGPASANFQIDPVLDRGVDSNIETAPGRGIFGFQGNFKPTLAAISNPAAVLEDAAEQTIQLTGISPGLDETENVTVTASSSNPGLIPDPAVHYTNPDFTGSLTYTPVADQSGTATITVTVSDGAGSPTTQTFQVVVTEVDDPPTLAAIDDPAAILEDAAVQTVNLSGISAGGHEAQTVTVTATSSVPDLIPHPTVTYTSPNGTGSLSYQPVASANGTATITVKVEDGVSNVTRSFQVAVTSVNDAPSFTAGPNQSVTQDAGPQSIQWASGFSAGPADEAGQMLTLDVMNSNSSLFTAPPSLSPTGLLTYTPLATASGTNIVNVTLRDNGSTANGGVNSVTKTFTIAVTTYIEEAGTYNGLVTAPTGIAPEHQRVGLVRVVAAKKGTFTGSLTLGGKKFPLKGNFTKDGVGHFKQNATTLPLAPDRTLALQLDVGGGTDKLRGTVTLQGTSYAIVEADRALYTAAKVPKPPFLSVPAGLVGKYTAHFAPKDPIDLGRPADEFPQGHGVATLSVSKAGVAKIVGTLADGTKVSYANSLSKGNSWPFYVPLAKGTGSIGGPVQFVDLVGASDDDDLDWFQPAGGKLYPNGWATGLRVDFFGSKFTRPVASAGQSILLALPTADTNGNVEARLTAGNIAGPGLFKALNVQPNNRVQVITPADDKLRLTLVPATGLVSGSFIHPVSGKKIAIKGIVDQTSQLGFGYFLDSTASGNFALAPEENPGTP